MITLSTTYQQTKSLVDPVNSTYQTVLTIDPSLGQSGIGGTYSCTVENDRGESSGTLVVLGKTCSLAPWYIMYVYPFCLVGPLDFTWQASLVLHGVVIYIHISDGII